MESNRIPKEALQASFFFGKTHESKSLRGELSKTTKDCEYALGQIKIHIWEYHFDGKELIISHPLIQIF